MLTIADAQSIFIGCLLEVDNRIVYVLNIDDKGIQNLHCIKTGETFFRKNCFEGYKPITYRLGYVNYAGQAAYVYRTTARQYKFGLHARNIAIMEGLVRDNLFMTVHSELQHLKNKAYLATFDNIYPTLKEALIAINAGATVVAFDKQFALANTMTIGYKDNPVGRVRNGKIEWDSGKEYLAQVIKKGQV